MYRIPYGNTPDERYMLYKYKHLERSSILNIGHNDVHIIICNM